MNPGLPPEAAPVSSSESVPVLGAAAASFEPPPRHPWYSWRRLGYNFLTLSLLAHLLLAVGAAYLVVSVSYPKKKMFAAPPAGGAQRAAEHKVSMAKAQQRSSAPVAVKRVVTTGVSKVALPAMPVVATDSAVMPVSMSGMSGSGTGLMGGNGGGGNGNGNGNGNGIGGLTFFGVRSGGTGLTGTFYDLKQTQSRQPTGMTTGEYTATLIRFVQSGFNDANLSRFYKAPQPLYADRVFTPDIPAELGPTAFGVQKEVQPTMWAVHYKGTIIPSESGTYRFAGVGDDVMNVRFDGRLVLEASVAVKTGLPGQETLYPHTDFHWPVMMGPKFQVEEGHPYSIDVLIGECPGGRSMADLMIEKEGATYGRGNEGPLLPIFRLSASTALPVQPPGSKGYLEHAANGPVWRTAAATSEPSVFSH